MSTYLAPVKSFSDLPALEKPELIELFRNASNEARAIENELSKISIVEQNVDEYRISRETEGKISIFILIWLSLMYVFPAIIYVAYKLNKRKKYDRLIAEEQEKVPRIKNRGWQIAQKCKILPLIPEDYRTPLALETMTKFLMYGQADDWKECSLRCIEQMSRWTLERNSAEGLELQKYTALMAKTAADSAGTAATAATVGAVFNILSWFV